MINLLFCSPNQFRLGRLTGMLINPASPNYLQNADVAPCLDFILLLRLINRSNFKFDVTIIDNSFGQSEEFNSVLESVIYSIHNKNRSTRVGIMGTSFPNELNLVKKWGVDFYSSTNYHEYKEWLILQIKKGYVEPWEIIARTHRVDVPVSFLRKKEISF